jgi:hypothetical protein
MLKADEVSNILNSIKISPSIQADSEEKEKSDLENSKSQASAMENAENEWREKLTEQYQDNKIDKEMRAILSEWLNGKPATRMILPNDEGVIVDYNSVSREFTAKMKRFNDEGQLVTSYNNVLAGDLSIDLKEWNGSIHIDLEYIPAASRFIDPQSIQDIFWWAPKFKEWAIKLLSIPEDERPKQYIKEIPRSSSGLSSVFFVYDKSTGPGVWVMGEEPLVEFADDYRKNYEFVKNALESGESLSLIYHPGSGTDFNLSVEQAQKFGITKFHDSRGLSSVGDFYLKGRYYNLKNLYLAASSVNNFLLKMADVYNNKNSSKNDLEKSKSVRDAVDKKLGLD